MSQHAGRLGPPAAAWFSGALGPDTLLSVQINLRESGLSTHPKERTAGFALSNSLPGSLLCRLTRLDLACSCSRGFVLMAGWPCSRVEITASLLCVLEKHPLQ